MALADNRAKIQELIDGINALPEAGSGGSGGPVLADVIVDGWAVSVFYTGENGNETASSNGTFKCVVPSILVATKLNESIYAIVSGDITIARDENYESVSVFYINGAGTIEMSNNPA